MTRLKSMCVNTRELSSFLCPLLMDEQLWIVCITDFSSRPGTSRQNRLTNCQSRWWKKFVFELGVCICVLCLNLCCVFIFYIKLPCRQTKQIEQSIWQRQNLTSCARKDFRHWRHQPMTEYFTFLCSVLSILCCMDCCR